MLYDLISIGNATMDIVARVGDDFLSDHGIRKSHSTAISHEKLLHILNHAQNPLYIPGGAGANVTHCIRALGGTSAFIGKISQDESGYRFRDAMKGFEVDLFLTEHTSAEPGSCQVFCLTTPDGERSFACYDGISSSLSLQDVPESAIARSHLSYFDGYVLRAPAARDVFLGAADMAHQAGRLSCFNPGDRSMIEEHPQAVADILGACDALICNHHEAEALYGEKSADLLARAASHDFSFGAVTDGGHGAYVFAKGEIVFIPALDISHIAQPDANGAGDHFSAGFLTGLRQNRTLEAAGELGRACAMDALSHLGARPQGTLEHLLSEGTKL
jgi:sugar/nucleoside kinase (ribokinase family)